jgi:hypothetical protein
MPVALVEFGSRSPDSIGRIWCVLVSVFLAVLFWWQELRHGRKHELGISCNKAVFPYLWRLFVLVLLRGARRSPEVLFVKLSRWTLDDGGKSGEVFFNKRFDCLQCCGLATLFRLLVSLGGWRENGRSCVVRVTWRWSEEDFAATCGVHQWRRVHAAVIQGRGGRSVPCYMHGFFFNLQAGVPIRRPFRSSAAASIVASLPSGVVPDDVADGRGVELIFVFGGAGLDCFSLFLVRVLFVIVECLFAFSLICKALHVNCYSTA